MTDNQYANALARQLGAFPHNDEGPVFRAPWEARAFAMTIMLHEKGAFSWPEWAQTLSARIRQFEHNHGPDNGEHYYDHWLAALEDLMARKRVVADTALDQRRQAWRDAAARTPHGQPIALHTQAAGSDPAT